MKEEDFKYLFKTYFIAICFYGERIVNNRQVAEDLAGDVFRQIWEKGDLKNVANVRAYLYTTMYHRCLKYLKQEKLYQGLANDHNYQALNFENPLQEQIRIDVVRQLELALNALPEINQKVIRMSYLEKLRTKDIARQLEMSESSVEKHKARGLEILRGHLSKKLFALLTIM